MEYSYGNIITAQGAKDTKKSKGSEWKNFYRVDHGEKEGKQARLVYDAVTS